MSQRQLDLFAAMPRPRASLDFDCTFARADRIELSDGAWVEHVRGWVSGDDVLFEHLRRVTPWHHEERRMYEKVVATPRLLGGVIGRDGPGHPILEAMRRALTARYGEEFLRLSLALYRDGRDSVAPHGDTIARDMLEPTHVATVSLGGTRRLLMKPAAGGRSVEFTLCGGDLYVMGGTAQRTWRHAIPKVDQAEPRIVVMFRPAWAERYPQQG